MRARWLTTAEAASYIGLGKEALASMRCRNQGPPYSKPNGGKVFYSIADIDAWLESGRVVPEP